MGVILCARNIKKSFGPTKALRSISLEAAQGEILAIMGPSGSGKTTLLYSLAAIANIDGGEIIFGNKRVDKLNDDQRSRLRRQQFGFVFQFNQLVPELTALDNIALPLLLDGSRRKIAYTEAKLWLEKVGLIGQSNNLPSELSGGQMQRVAIARAMIIQPKILFADEPTGSLDSRNSKKIMNLFIGVANHYKTTVIMVTHEPSIAAYADRKIIVRDGLISRDGA
ncbi:MAG: ABC transporter ATP-binding protein [Actinobacteria bacterium]|nr:ABC transporter ATP-binding protein [Actinomycetota bacterium]